MDYMIIAFMILQMVINITCFILFFITQKQLDLHNEKTDIVKEYADKLLEIQIENIKKIQELLDTKTEIEIKKYEKN